MIKTYKSKTPFVISLTFDNGQYKYIKFAPMSRGGGIYITEKEIEQKALEAQKFFGTRYVLAETVLTPEEQEAQTVKTTKTEVVEAPAEQQAEATPMETVQVTDIEEAREYLNEHFGVAKRNMRSTASVKAIAEKNGIIFEGI